MRLEALKLVRYMNKMGEFPTTDRRTTTLKNCADLAMQRLRGGKRKAVKVMAISSSMITVEIPLQKHTIYKTPMSRIEAQFFVPDTLTWRLFKEAAE